MTESYVVAIGATNIDIKGYAHTDLMPGTSNRGTIYNNPGGVARNVAENLARFGEEVVLMSAIGNDGPGLRIQQRMASAGVNLSRLLVSEAHHTSAYIALYDKQKSLIHSIDDTDVLELITPQYIYQNRDLLREAEMVMIDSNIPSAALSSLMSFAKEENLCLIADPTSVVLAEKLRPHLSNLYMMTPNISEAEVFTEQKISSRQEATAAAHKLVAAGLNLVIITLAENGVVYATPDTSGYIPALTTKIVDLTGASDAMTATIMFGLLHDMPLDEAVRLGANAAAWTIRSEESVVEDLTADMLYDW